MLLTSPLAVTLGLSLTIPLAMAGDLYRHAPVGAASLIGGVLVLSSFIGNGILDLKEAEKQTVEFVEGVVGVDGAEEREGLLERRESVDRAEETDREEVGIGGSGR